MYCDPKYFKEMKVFSDSAFEKWCNSLNYIFKYYQNQSYGSKRRITRLYKRWPVLWHSLFDKIKNLQDYIEEFYSDEGEKKSEILILTNNVMIKKIKLF